MDGTSRTCSTQLATKSRIEMEPNVTINVAGAGFRAPLWHASEHRLALQASIWARLPRFGDNTNVLAAVGCNAGHQELFASASETDCMHSTATAAMPRTSAMHPERIIRSTHCTHSSGLSSY